MKQVLEMMLPVDSNEMAFAIDLADGVAAEFYVTIHESRLFDRRTFTITEKGLTSSSENTEVKVVSHDAVNAGADSVAFEYEAQGIAVRLIVSANGVAVEWAPSFNEMD